MLVFWNKCGCILCTWHAVRKTGTHTLGTTYIKKSTLSVVGSFSVSLSMKHYNRRCWRARCERKACTKHKIFYFIFILKINTKLHWAIGRRQERERDEWKLARISDKVYFLRSHGAASLGRCPLDCRLDYCCMYVLYYMKLRCCVAIAM